MQRYRYWLLLGMVLMVAGGLRLVGLDRTGLIIDEAYSLRMSSLGFSDILAGTAADQHPPLYYWILHLWMQVAGQSVFAVRFLSVWVAWITVALAYRIGRRFGEQTGLMSAAVLAIAPAHIGYAQVARMYALLILLVTLSTWLAWRWWTDPSARSLPRTLLYIAITLAALYTHYFALFLIVTQNVAGLTLGLIAADEDRWHLAGRWLVTQAAVMGGFLPWLPTMIQQTSHRMTWIPPLSWAQVRNSWLYLLYGDEWHGNILDHARAILGLVLMGLAIWPRQRGRHLAWVFLWFWVPMLAIILVASFKPILQYKQLLIVVPPLAVLLAIGLLRPRRWAWQVTLLILFVVPAGLAIHQQYIEPKREYWDDIASYLNTTARPDDLLYLNVSSSALALDYYLTVDLLQAGYPDEFDILQGGWVGEIATPGRVATQLEPLAEQHERIWLVEFVTALWDPEGLVRAWLQAHYREVNQVRFGGVTVSLFSREAEP